MSTPEITVVGSANLDLVVDVDLPIKFYTYFVEPEQWTSPEPVWYQTFVATGTEVSGVSFVVAAADKRKIDVAIL